MERLPVALADAPYAEGDDVARRLGGVAGVLLVGLPVDRGGRHDDRRADLAVLRRGAAVLRARAVGRGQGVRRGRSAWVGGASGSRENAVRRHSRGG